MHFLYLAAVLLAAAAAGLWYTQAFGRGGKGEADAGEREEQAVQVSREGIEALGKAADALAELMKHPELGGPGFITVRFSLTEASGGAAVVTAQYPNIREVLYRRILRQELEPEALRAEGVPEALLALSPGFETESGGMVLVSVQAAGLDPAWRSAWLAAGNGRRRWRSWRRDWGGGARSCRCGGWGASCC